MSKHLKAGLDHSALKDECAFLDLVFLLVCHVCLAVEVLERGPDLIPASGFPYRNFMRLSGEQRRRALVVRQCHWPLYPVSLNGVQTTHRKKAASTHKPRCIIP